MNGIFFLRSTELPFISSCTVPELLLPEHDCRPVGQRDGQVLPHASDDVAGRQENGLVVAVQGRTVILHSK